MVSTFGFVGRVGEVHFNQMCIGDTEGERIAMHHHLHRVAKRGEFHQLDGGIGDEAHVQKMLPTRAFTAYRLDARRLSYINLI